MKNTILFLGLAMFCWACAPDDEAGDNTNLPTLIVDDVIITETNQDTVLEVQLRLERVPEEDVLLSFSTIEGSAKGGVDFNPIRDGTIFFPTGAQEKVIPIDIIGDEIAEDEESFGIVLLSISNAKLGRERVNVTIADND